MSADQPLYVTLPRRALLALGAAAVVAAAGAAMLVRAIPFASSSRFEPALRVRERRDVPPELETLIKSVRESNKDGGRQVLSPTILLHLRRVTAARLASLRLDLDDPTDHAAIQGHVSRTMWTVLAPGPGSARAQHLPSLEIPATSLPALLDELERL
jgi:hypothetical protein